MYCRNIFPALAAGLQLALGVTAAHAAPDPRSAVFYPPTGYFIQPSDYSRSLYGASAPKQANWHVSQWDIPRDLPGFDHAQRASNAYLTVSATGDLTSITQDGGAVPCARVFPSGRSMPDEFDAFLAPNSPRDVGFPQAVAPSHPLLSAIGHLYHTISVEPVAFAIGNVACTAQHGATKVNLVTSLVLTNAARHQTLFYDLSLGGSLDGRAALRDDVKSIGWYATGVTFETGAKGAYRFADDILASFGQTPAARLGLKRTYALDLLPRLTQVIRQGAASGLDQDLSHWTVTGTFHGDQVWGHAKLTAQWSNFTLTAAK